MQDDEQCEQDCVAVYQLINCVNKAIRHTLRSFDDEWEKRHDCEMLSEEDDLCDAPSMRKWLECEAEQDVSLFWRSDGLGEPMRIRWEELALSMDELTPQQRDAIIKVFQEEMPMAAYAREEGISRRMAYKRLEGILGKLLDSMDRRIRKNVCRNEEKKKMRSARKKEPGRGLHDKRHYRGSKRKR